MKKLLAVLLAMVMVLSLFAGCGNQKKKSSSKKSSSKKNKESSSATDDTDGTGGTGSTDSTGNSGLTGDKKPIPGTNSNEATEGVMQPTEPQPNGGIVRPYPGNTDNSGVAAGTILDEPEKLFDTDATNAINITVEAETDGKATTIQIIVMSNYNGNQGVVYALNGPADTEEAIYEVNGNNIVKYAKNKSDAAFKLDTTTSADDKQYEMDEIGDFLQVFMACQEVYSDIQFRKSNAVTTHATGPVYAYDVVYDGEVDGLILIDKATGLLVKVEAFSSDFCYTVTNFKLSGFNFPNYK